MPSPAGINTAGRLRVAEKDPQLALVWQRVVVSFSVTWGVATPVGRYPLRLTLKD